MLGIAGQIITVGAHAVGLATHATPALLGRDLTEFYLTQPAIMAQASYGPFEFNGMLNFEGLTLERGELNAGVWGEGYVDRRHPHTYLHEAVLTWQDEIAKARVSLSAGKGFAPYGTDDPMVRHFVKYPANHHLSQILERLIAIGAVRYGPLIVEAGLFNGDEPVDPADNGSLDRFGDSWSARATAIPLAGAELQFSYAQVKSPENQFGFGLDHEGWNASARMERSGFYGLIEVGGAKEISGDVAVFELDNFLAEVALQRAAWQLAARFEQSDRPEEERLIDLFRTQRPAHNASILGTTQWTTASLQLARNFQIARFTLQPLLEIAHLRPRPNERPAVYEPENLYGSDRLWSFSFGIRSTIGSRHHRMGRYGAARPASEHHNH